MYSHFFGATALAFASILLPFIPAPASAQTQSASSCLRTTADRLLIADSDASCSTDEIRVVPFVYSELREDHQFELFNNSYRDILFLHLMPLDSFDQEMVFGGTRKLAPGRAWSVNLNHGCDYDLLVEYENGVQEFYEAVNTCDYRGIQLR